ncbi:type II secretion system F family protein [Pararhodobacter sp. SW119]|uniref:type II secretion system F family protein n=1 Tax=Pararhodobacter sp. SW119 TaxID=2780075 RepID=UPI001ADF80E7|nr:type II secretion system F family protein [Pararhodobacter sp. SW119]
MIDTLLQGLASPLGVTVALTVGGLTIVLMVLTGDRSKSDDPYAKVRVDRSEGDGGMARRQLSSRTEQTELQKKLERYNKFLEPESKEDKDAARKEMIQAGYFSKTAVRDYHAAKFILGMGGLLLGLLILLFMPSEGERSILSMALPVMLPTLIGYYLPIYWVNKRKAERQEQISRGFPDSLDMLLICAEAGQSLDQAIARVGKELKAGYPALAEELETVSLETKAGKDRFEVLKDFGERCGNADIRSFVTVMIQSATYGTSVSEALRVYAAEMRDKRVTLAEEKANVLPTKLTLGTMMFTVPPLLIILVGPSVVGMMEIFSSGSVAP